MATATYVPLATTTLGSATSSINFSSIPQTYTDLRIVFTTTSTANMYLSLNGDASSSYSTTNLYGNGTSPSSVSNTSIGYAYTSAAQTNISYPSMVIVDIFSYANSSVYKTILSSQATDKNGSGIVGSTVSLWRSTAAVNAIGFTAYIGGTYQPGTTVTIWGI